MYLEIALKYKVKKSKNGKFPSNHKASQIDFETQISPHRSVIDDNNKPLKGAFEKYKLRGFLSEFYGILSQPRLLSYWDTYFPFLTDLYSLELENLKHWMQKNELNKVDPFWYLHKTWDFTLWIC